MASFGEDRWAAIVHIATDGETYGHHHTYGEMTLSYCLSLIEADPTVELINYPAYLDRHPPAHEAEIFENSSWSCIHGVERWRADCGCNSGGNGNWHQKWRAPLREAMDWLRDRCVEIHERVAPQYFKDIWEVRDAYIDVVNVVLRRMSRRFSPSGK
jgi:alpha-amylase/alpha-mannosidase (GH57 family)